MLHSSLIGELSLEILRHLINNHLPGQNPGQQFLITLEYDVFHHSDVLEYDLYHHSDVLEYDLYHHGDVLEYDILF